MRELDDHELLVEFVRDESEAAFATIVERYVNLAYSTALRFTGNAQHAEEVTQAVFIILAHKAGSLRAGTVLSGWLYQTARLTAANFVKGEIRRQRREQEVYMQSTLNTPDVAAWEQIAPLLDEAMGQLGETDRHAVVLRYFENKTAAEAAAALKLSEAAAHKRTSRAIEKLRRIFAKRGITSAVAISAVLSAYSVQAAPGGLAKTISAVAAAKGTAAGGSTLALVKGTMKTMTWIKIKFAAVAGVAILLAGGAATVAISQTGGGGDALTAQSIAKQSQAAYAALSSYSDEGKTVSSIGTTAVTPITFTLKLARPNLYRVEWDQNMGFSDQKGAVWCAGNGDFTKIVNSTRPAANAESALATAAGVSGRSSASIPTTFFNMRQNTLGDPMQSSERKADENVGDTDCYVLAGSKDGRTRTIWIGKQDFLIRQIETDTSAETMKKIMAEAAAQNPRMNAVASQAPAGESKAIETHTNIVVNQAFSPADFAP